MICWFGCLMLISEWSIAQSVRGLTCLDSRNFFWAPDMILYFASSLYLFSPNGMEYITEHSRCCWQSNTCRNLAYNDKDFLKLYLHTSISIAMCSREIETPLAFTFPNQGRDCQERKILICSLSSPQVNDIKLGYETMIINIPDWHLTPDIRQNINGDQSWKVCHNIKIGACKKYSQACHRKFSGYQDNTEIILRQNVQNIIYQGKKLKRSRI